MKSPIIRINDVSEIDTSRVSVYDLNNRYLDRRGNMYGLKYDRVSKKIQIIRIVRTLTDEAQLLQQRIIRKKIDQTKNPSEEDLPSEQFDIQEESFFDPDLVVSETLSLVSAHKERLRGIMMNIKNSNIFPKENKHESVELENIFRNLEIDGIQQFEKVENYEKELSHYPRSITYYQAKIDNHGRAVIEALGNSKDKIMNFIHLYEMYISLRAVYKNLKKILMSLVEFINQRDVESGRKFTPFEKQSFEDSQVSIANTLFEIDDILNKLAPLGEYLKSPENF
jgi:hypothetical protein